MSNTVTNLCSVEVCSSCVLNITKASAWRVARDWGSSPWMRGVGDLRFQTINLSRASPTEVGSTRLFIVNNAQMFEQLTALDDQDHILRWKLVSHPQTVSPFQHASFVNYVSSLHVRAVTIDNSTYAEWKGQFFTEPHNVQLMQSTLEGWYLAGFQNLQDFVLALAQQSHRVKHVSTPAFHATGLVSSPRGSQGRGEFTTSSKGNQHVGAASRNADKFVSAAHVYGPAQHPHDHTSLYASKPQVAQQQRATSAFKTPGGVHTADYSGTSQQQFPLPVAHNPTPTGQLEAAARRIPTNQTTYSLNDVRLGDQQFQPRGPGPPIGTSSDNSSRMSVGSNMLNSNAGHRQKSSNQGTDSGISSGEGYTYNQGFTEMMPGVTNDQHAIAQGHASKLRQPFESRHSMPPDGVAGASHFSVENNRSATQGRDRPLEMSKSASLDKSSFTFTNSLARKLEREKEDNEEKGRSSLEEEVARLEARHYQVHKSVKQPSAAVQAQFSSPFASPFASQFAASPLGAFSNQQGGASTSDSSGSNNSGNSGSLELADQKKKEFRGGLSTSKQRAESGRARRQR